MAIPVFHISLHNLGLSVVEAAGTITDNQQIELIEELKILHDEGIVDLCKALHCPGGMITNPHTNQAGQPIVFQTLV